MEHVNHTWVHLAELPHEPPGYYFDSRTGVPKESWLPWRSALFHYVPGRYMHYLHFLSTQACTCAVAPGDVSAILDNVAVGVYSSTRRLAKLDLKRINATWGKGLQQRELLKASGREYGGIRGDLARLRELTKAFPEAGWLLLLPVEHYVVAANLALRIRELDGDSTAPLGNYRAVMVYGPTGGGQQGDAEENSQENSGMYVSEGALLVGRDLAETMLSFEENLSGGVFPTGRWPGGRGIVGWARTLSSVTVVDDAGFVVRLPGPAGEDDVGCPATFPMDPDLADLKPEFTLTESNAIMSVAEFLLRSTTETECVTRLI